MAGLYAGKIAQSLSSPLGFTLLLLIGCVLLRRFAAAQSVLLVVSFVVLASCSAPAFSAWLWHRLVVESAVDRVGGAPQAQMIVVLGGGWSGVAGYTWEEAARLAPENRLVEAARLYQAGSAPRILLCGGAVPDFLGGNSSRTQALGGYEILRGWGVPAEALQMESRSRTTHENAVNSHALLEPVGVKRILLVTSPYHMRRAAATFRRVGFEVVPAPTADTAGPPRGDLVFDLLPDLTALERSTVALKEMAGELGYKLMGWA